MADDQRKTPLVAKFNGNPRIQWTPTLHERFLSAVTKLGGPYDAKPKAILETMGVQRLNLRHIKSHLQKYRATISGAKGLDKLKNREKIEDEFLPALIVNNAPLAQTMPIANDMGDYRVYNVPGVLATTKGISYMAHVPYNIRGNNFYDISQVVNEIQGSSMVPVPYDVGGLAVYGVPELSLGMEGIPNMLPNSYATRSQDVHASSQVPIGTEINSYLVSAPQTIGSHEVYDIPGFQIGMEGIVEQQERYTNRFIDVKYINDAGNQLGDFTSMMDYPNNTPLLPTWETTYTMGDQDIYNQLPTMLQGIEGGVVQEEYQNYGSSLDSGNEEGKGTMGLHKHDVVANYLDFPTNNMPYFDTMPTLDGMGGYEVCDGSSIQREIKGVQQARLTSM